MAEPLRIVGTYSETYLVPERLNPEAAFEHLCRYNGTIYTFNYLRYPEPGDYIHYAHNMHSRVPDRRNFGAGYGLKWVWSELEAWARQMRETNNPVWQGSDFYTIRDHICNVAKTHQIGFGRVMFVKFVEPEIIEVIADSPVDPENQYHLYRRNAGNNQFLYLHMINEPTSNVRRTSVRSPSRCPDRSPSAYLAE